MSMLKEFYLLRPCCEIELESCLGKSFIQHSSPLNNAGVHLTFKRLQVGQCKLFFVSDLGMLFLEGQCSRKGYGPLKILERKGKKR